MPSTLNRPTPVFDPAKGLLANDHFQFAYVTNDAEVAMDVFRTRFGVTRFREADNAMANGAMLLTRTVWIGARMIEIVEPQGAGLEMYSDMLPPGDGFAMRLHHFGFVVPDEAAWEALEREIARQGWPVRSSSHILGFGRTCNVEVPELGHYLEYILCYDGLAERLNATPVA